MNLGFSRRGDYVLRAALHLARHNEDGRWHKASEVASATLVSPGYVRQILRLLVQHDLAQAQAGNRGGYRLSRRPEEITLLEVIEVAEGPLMNTRCVLMGTPCGPDHPCSLYPTLSRAQHALRDELRRASLRTVLNDSPAPHRGGVSGRASRWMG